MPRAGVVHSRRAVRVHARHQRQRDRRGNGRRSAVHQSQQVHEEARSKQELPEHEVETRGRRYRRVRPPLTSDFTSNR